MERWTLEGPETLELDRVSDLRVKLVAGHVDVVATEGPPRVEVHEITGDPVVVTLSDGRLEVGYEDLGGIFDFDSGSARETLENVGDALRDLLENGRSPRTDEWLRKFPWFGRKRRAVVSVAVPRQCGVRLNVVSSTAVVAGFDGHTKVKSVSGDVTLDGLSGTVDAHTVSGALEAQMLSATLDFVTVSGDLTVVEATSDRIHGRTVSGDLTADIALTQGGRLEFSSVSGNVTTRLPETTGARVTATSTSGKTTSGFDALQSERKPGRRSVSGTIGDGSGSIEVRTVSGDIHLLPRRAPKKALAENGAE